MSEYWKEFVRVNCDRFLLLILIVYMLAIHADERIIYAAVGALVGAIQHNRWQRTGGGGS